MLIKYSSYYLITIVMRAMRHRGLLVTVSVDGFIGLNDLNTSNSM